VAIAGAPLAAANATITNAYALWVESGSSLFAQGTITATGGGGDMTLDNTSIASAQVVSVTSFTLTDANS
jgi:hypothetical protein